METLYKKISDTFNDHPEVFSERTLPVPRTIDIDYGQADDPEAFELFLPAILLNFDVKAGSDNPDVLTLDVIVLQEPGAGTENFSERQDEGLSYVRFLKAVKYCFNNLASDESSPLRYMGERKAASQYFKYHVLTYTCFIDSYTDSLHKPTLVDGSIESIKIDGKLKQKDGFPQVEIETY